MKSLLLVLSFGLFLGGCKEGQLEMFNEHIQQLKSAKSEVLKYEGRDLSLEYLKSIEKYENSFLKFTYFLGKQKEKSLAKVEKEKIEMICRDSFFTKEERKEIHNSCAHPFFRICPEFVYQMDGLLGSIYERVKNVHDLKVYSGCNSVF